MQRKALREDIGTKVVTCDDKQQQEVKESVREGLSFQCGVWVLQYGGVETR